MSGVQNLGFENEPQVGKNVSINFVISHLLYYNSSTIPIVKRFLFYKLISLSSAWKFVKILYTHPK
jgi:hypothetical protein